MTHLVTTLSVYEVGPPTSPVPVYNGPTDWYTDTILRSLAALARRMYTAEDALSALHEVEKCGPESKKRRSVGDSPPMTSSGTSHSDTICAESNGCAYHSLVPPFFTLTSSVESIPATLDESMLKVR